MVAVADHIPARGEVGDRTAPDDRTLRDQPDAQLGALSVQVEKIGAAVTVHVSIADDPCSRRQRWKRADRRGPAALQRPELEFARLGVLDQDVALPIAVEVQQHGGITRPLRRGFAARRLAAVHGPRVSCVDEADLLGGLREGAVATVGSGTVRGDANDERVTELRRDACAGLEDERPQDAFAPVTVGIDRVEVDRSGSRIPAKHRFGAAWKFDDGEGG